MTIWNNRGAVLLLLWDILIYVDFCESLQQAWRYLWSDS